MTLWMGDIRVRILNRLQNTWLIKVVHKLYFRNTEIGARNSTILAKEFECGYLVFISYGLINGKNVFIVGEEYMSTHVLFLLGLYSICIFTEAFSRMKGKVILLLHKRPFWLQLLLQNKNNFILGISEGQLLVTLKVWHRYCCSFWFDLELSYLMISCF